MATRYGRQPARIIILEQGLFIRKVAEAINETDTHLYKALSGVIVPSPNVRKRLPELLGRPLEELFTPEALEREYWHPSVSK